MNYLHAYHAGNFADVLKHVVLFALVDALSAKPKPWTFVDTHAGRGWYRLDAPEAAKTGEYLGGVMRLIGAGDLPPLLERWCEQLLTLPENASGLQVYPGSPWQVAQRLRTDDQILLCEVQQAEATVLRELFKRDARVHVHERDGYAALKALLPPRHRRGLILIDPPYEAQQAEYARIGEAIDVVRRRWPESMLAVWYPIKLRGDVQPWLRQACQVPAKRTLCIELLPHPAQSPLRLNGSGMVVFNAPWNLDSVLDAPLKVLSERLGEGLPAECELRWLRCEEAD